MHAYYIVLYQLVKNCIKKKILKKIPTQIEPFVGYFRFLSYFCVIVGSTCVVCLPSQLSVPCCQDAVAYLNVPSARRRLLTFVTDVKTGSYSCSKGLAPRYNVLPRVPLDS